MKCIIGLGNPGDQYKDTKHNFGYWVIDSYLKKNDLKLKLGKGDYVFADNSDFIIAKTTAFMNNSGHAVKSIVDYFSIQLDELVIVYDDIDLPLGSVRFKQGGSSGGHRGLDSIIYRLSSQDFQVKSHPRNFSFELKLTLHFFQLSPKVPNHSSNAFPASPLPWGHA